VRFRDNAILKKLKPIRIRSRWFKNGCKQCYSSISKGKSGYAAAQAQLKALQSSYNEAVTMRYKA
jgi:hypothetical protein